MPAERHVRIPWKTGGDVARGGMRGLARTENFRNMLSHLYSWARTLQGPSRTHALQCRGGKRGGG